jgi:hypothetical protein
LPDPTIAAVRAGTDSPATSGTNSVLQPEERSVAT